MQTDDVFVRVVIPLLCVVLGIIWGLLFAYIRSRFNSVEQTLKDVKEGLSRTVLKEFCVLQHTNYEQQIKALLLPVMERFITVADGALNDLRERVARLEARDE